jgi:cytochrome c oxidase subunit 1
VVTGQILQDIFGATEGVSGNEIYNRALHAPRRDHGLHGHRALHPRLLGNFFLPIMLGAKDVAFPRLNLLSWYIYVFGSIFGVLSILMGGVDTGWTFYTPYSTTTDADHWRVVLMVLAAFILGFSSILTGLNFIVTVHKLRAPGMGWFDMPLFVWAVYATSIIQVLATPVIGITLLLLIFERIFHDRHLRPRLGGDPVLYQHFFWFYSHPVVYVMILPAMGIISESSPSTAARRSSATAPSPSPRSASPPCPSWSGATTCSPPWASWPP